MADYQILTCPNCGGAGCATCNNTGKVKVAADQLQKLKQMVGQSGQVTSQPAPQPLSPSQTNEKVKTNLAGIVAFSLLAVIAGAAAASWYFLKSFKPFFAGLVSVLLLVGSTLAGKQPFFKLKEPDDFLNAIKKFTG